MKLVLKRISFVIFLLISAILVIYNTSGVPQTEIPLPADSLSSPSHIRALIKYQSYYPFINYDRNYIEYASASALDTFFKKIPQTPYRKLKILHFGDSHLQADILSGSIRNRLEEILGYGGRGLVFPFKAAATHSAYDYKTYCTGVWDYTRNTQRDAVYDMGVIGATVHTTDSGATFKFVFRDGFIKGNYTQLKLFCKQDSASYDLRMKYCDQAAALYIDCNNEHAGKSYIQIQLPKATDTLEFFVHKTDSSQHFFECYGLSIESSGNSGVLYNSTGINGAGYRSILKQRLFGAQLAEMDPDLVIIDLGANDFFAGGYYAADIESNLRKIIDIIHTASPEAAIIVSNAQDIYYRRKRDVVECKDFSELTKKIAIEKHCAYYNYYEVSGGKASMNKWFSRGLAQSDKVHLTTPGYNVRGELFLNALLDSYLTYLLNPGKDSLVASNYLIDTTALKSYFVEDINFAAENKKVVTEVYHEPEVITEGDNKIYYTIRSGDNLGSIAQRYGVSVRELQYWNGLSGTKIIAGKSLVIYKKGAAVQNPPQQNNQVQTTKPPVQNKPQATVQNNQRNSYRKVSHIVKSGDSLWAIAQKYNTTVDAIKKANNLKSDKLSIGQILLIP